MKTEARIQQECYLWFWNNYCLKHHKPREIIYHVPNEGANNGRLVKIGLLKGCADLIMSFRGYTLYVEIKSSRGSQTPSQKKFQKHIETMPCNHLYYLARSVEEFVKIVKYFDI